MSAMFAWTFGVTFASVLILMVCLFILTWDRPHDLGGRRVWPWEIDRALYDLERARGAILLQILAFDPRYSQGRLIKATAWTIRVSFAAALTGAVLALSLHLTGRI